MASPDPSNPPATPENAGFFGSLVNSIFEPGVNKSLFMAMNTSFLLLIFTLFGLAFLTSWSKHVLFLMLVSMGLWGSMIWFVHEIGKVQGSDQNLPKPEEIIELNDLTFSKETKEEEEARKNR